MDVFELSSKRFTTKHYDPSRKISPDDMGKLKEILRLTPSSVNSQPWHFIIGSSDKAKKLIRPAIMDFNWPRTDDCSHFVVLCIKEDLDESHLNAVTAQENADGRFPNEQIKEEGDSKRKWYVSMKRERGQLRSWATHQVYIAMASLLYGAASLGIQSTAIEGYNPSKLDAILSLREKGLRSVAIVTLGYGALDDSNASRKKSRLPAETLFTELD
ncbi:MAG: oxygen-insensitive NAD(P)H nitroreductase [Oxalobacter sp.]|nr:oxygen-insensitive NAD(P)H nitroreductase [Oxalobacter sp.]